MENKTNNKLIIRILIMTIIIDIMGVGLVFPIMPALFFDVNTTFLLGGANAQHWAYSLALAAWPLGLVIGGPVLGELSDKFGRKKLLIIALFLTSFAYVLSAISVYMCSYLFFMISRLLSGMVGGAFEIAQATVIDVSSKKNKAKNLGYITMAASLGFVVGPIVTSLTTNSYINLDLTTPFWFAAVLALINTICIIKFMKWDIPKHSQLKISVMSLVRTVTFLFTDKRIVFISIIYILMQAGWGFYGQGVGMFLNQIFGYSTSTIGLFYAATGLSVALCSIFFQSQIMKFFGEQLGYIIYAFVCGTSLILAVLLISNQLSQWLLGIIGAASQLLCYTALLTTLSHAVSSKEQGKVMGSAGAGFGLAWFINDVLMGGLSSYSIKAPIFTGGIFLYISLIMMIGLIFYKLKKTKMNKAVS